jgi:hypothetical protein
VCVCVIEFLRIEVRVIGAELLGIVNELLHPCCFVAVLFWLINVFISECGYTKSVITAASMQLPQADAALTNQYMN